MLIHMKGIILDTNFLMIPFTQKVDIFSEFDRVCQFPFELFIVSKTMDEFENIMIGQSGKDKLAAKLAKSLIEAKKIKIIDVSKGHVDDLILEVAKEKGYFVATQDKNLKKRLKESDVPIIFLRQKKYIVVEK